MAQNRVPMPPSQRAKQFSMFDALKGLREALAAVEQVPQPRRELGPDAVEELNRTLTQLQPGDCVTVVYYCDYQQAYTQLTGTVTRVDSYWRMLRLGDVCVDFDEIAELILA